MIQFVITVFIIYIVYKFITRFLIPVFVTTRAVRKQFRSIKEEFEHAQQKATGFNNTSAAAEPTPKPKNNAVNPKDYIDFEEVK
jgi:hypothetical protein